jgi:hypothetical protein
MYEKAIGVQELGGWKGYMGNVREVYFEIKQHKSETI